MRFERLWTLFFVLVLLNLLHPQLPFTTANEGTAREPARIDDHHQLINTPLKVTIKRGSGGGGGHGGGGHGGGVSSGGRGVRGGGAWIPTRTGGGGGAHHSGSNKGIHDGFCLGFLCSVLLVFFATLLLLWQEY